MLTTLELNKLSVSDRLLIINKIWESVEQDSAELSSPHWYKDILNKRMDKIQNGKSKFKSFELAKKGIASMS